MAVYVRKAVFLALVVAFSVQCEVVTAFDVSYLQGCPEFNNVTELHLNQTRLTGSIPPEIGRCTALEVLDLYLNNVSGIPPEIGQLWNLRVLNVSYNSLKGPIPAEIGQLRNLEALRLGVNRLSGPIPDWIGNLTKLKELELGTLQRLSGSIPTALCRLTKLQELEVTYTNLTGHVPQCLGNLTQLRSLDLSYNTKLQVGESIQLVLGTLGNLTKLVMWGANIVGPVPVVISGLSKLQTLRLSSNNISSVPGNLSNLVQLQVLDLSYNSLWGEDVLSSLCQLPAIKELTLFGNNLSGPIPSCIKNWSRMTWLDLGRNAISGTVPPELALVPNMKFLTLGPNNLSGPLPVEILAKLKNLTSVYLRGNRFSGPIPPGIYNLTALSSSLDLSSNELTGPIPSEIGRMTKLSTLNLASNRLVGPIPPSLGQMPLLSELVLANNPLLGTIPPFLGNLTSLTKLNLSSCGLSGPLPSELGQLGKLKFLYLRNNSLNGSLTSLSGNNSSGLLLVDLGQNNLTGTIPSVWFEGDGLGAIYLDHNRLSGPIPSYVGKMKLPWFLAGFSNFVLLDLSSNQFNGSIPPEVLDVSTSALTFNLSNNNLSGPVRVGPAFNDTRGALADASAFSAGLDLGNNGPLAVLPGSNFSGRGVFALPNLTFTGTGPLVAPDLRVMQLGSDKIRAGKKLDLRSLPATCPYVSYSHGKVSDIVFWDACYSSSGCVVNLVGTGSKLSAATQEEICLNKISVFLEGDAPIVVFPYGNPRNSYLGNSRGGQYRFNESNFIDGIDLGRGGSAYTGVSFARVQDGNLCGNPEAGTVVGVTYGVFAVLMLLSSVGWWVAGRLNRFPKTSGKKRAPVVALGAYLFAIGRGLLTWTDLATDIVFVASIWGGWSAWFLLAFIIAPYVLSAACGVRVYLETGSVDILRQVRVKWVCYTKGAKPSDPTPLESFPLWKYPLVVLLSPVGLVCIVLLDLAALLDKAGLHLRRSSLIYSLESYSDFRGRLELTLRSIPGAIFQSTLYLLGSSRATRIYIDQNKFILSIAVSLITVVVHYNLFLHELQSSKVAVVATLRKRFSVDNCQPCLLTVGEESLAKNDTEKQEHF